MLGVGVTALDLSAVLQLVLTALAVVFGSLLILRKAASRYFFVDAAFESAENRETRRRMPIGGGGSPAADSCAVCQRPGPKKCSRCKGVSYCSQVCQIKHWGSHKLNCKQARVADKNDVVSSNTDECRRWKSCGFSSISLMPARGTCKVLQEPKKILFPYNEFVSLFNWDKPGFPPCGLLNHGNSCFANVVLQCLACTRPLIAYLLEKDHSRGCVRKLDDWCFLCELQVHIQRASGSMRPFSPINILSRLPNIGGNLGYEKQEDAHEFMRFAIDRMQSICLDEFGGEKVLDPSTQETTLIQHIFGGHLRSQVICTNCNMISNRYENMMDLTVEIQGEAESMEECLDQFTTKEWLDGENMYKCDGCNDYVRAWKRLTVHQAPNILTIALKRFQSGRFGKLNKRVTFPETLDITPYMSGDGDDTCVYSLYAVVVHVDMLNASFFGHYICYTKDYYGNWYRIDDCKVTDVEVAEVLSQGAYMLLYKRRTARREPFVKPTEASKKHLAKDQVASSVSIATVPMKVESADCVAANTGPQSNCLPCVVTMDVSLQQDTGHERNFAIKTKSTAEKESDDIGSEISAAEIKPTPMPEDLSVVDMDYSKSSSSGSEDVESLSSLKTMGPKSDSLVETSSTKAETLELRPSIDYCGPSSLGPENLEEGKSILPLPIASPSPLGEISPIEIEANKASSRPVEIKSKDDNIHDCKPCSSVVGNLAEQTPSIASCSPSDSAVKRLSAFSCVSEGTRNPSKLGNDFTRPKQLFSRGFLDRPARPARPAAHKGRIQSGNCGGVHFNQQSVCDDNMSPKLPTENGKNDLPCDSSSNSNEHRRNGDDVDQLGEANSNNPSKLGFAKSICVSDSRTKSVPLNGHADTSPGSSVPLFMPGFLNNPMKKLKKEDGAGGPCYSRASCNGFSIHGTDDLICRTITDGSDASADENGSWVCEDGRLPSVSDGMDTVSAAWPKVEG